MNRIFTFLLCLLFIPSIFSQKMIEVNKVWSYVDLCWSVIEPTITCDEVIVYSLGAEEWIDNVAYHRLRVTNQGFLDYNDPVWWELTDILLREDEMGKVYAKVNDEPEELLYDFTLAINDVFFNEMSNCSMTLVGKDSIELYNGEKAQRLIFDNGEEWIEGIGSTNAFFSTCDGNDFLLCVKKEEEFLFHDHPECFFFFVNTEDLNNNEVSIYPNPTNSILMLEATTGVVEGNFYLYNSIGELVLNRFIDHQAFYTIDIQNLPSGVYYLKIGDLIEKVFKLD